MFELRISSFYENSSFKKYNSFVQNFEKQLLK